LSDIPKTRYAKSGGINVAYQVVGAGPPDLVYVPGWLSNVEMMWENPLLARFLRRLASFSRLIVFDKRGTGLSDRVPELPTLEQRMEDVRAVMDAAGSERAALIGISEGASMSILMAETPPFRRLSLGSNARRTAPWRRGARTQLGGPKNRRPRLLRAEYRGRRQLPGMARHLLPQERIAEGCGGPASHE